MNLTMKYLINALFLLLSPVALAAQASEADSNAPRITSSNKLLIEVNLSQFNMLTEKPYLALWYSLPNKQYTPLKVLRADSKWLRDLKSFWRYIARYQREKLDGITSATVRSGSHKFSFELPATAATETHRYWLEVVRENGTRELLEVSMAAKQPSRNCINGTKEVNLFCVEYR
ncbi:DUF2271 domain-containing protein [Shewanella sp. KX20019]|uniref:DUF2271 domain-containing protein n=1 Tax=Shewanella sp. KX20019 TaxID=2803864 RepID=UPI001928670C|nr:DUF2271 domain-containing protein [Shewanella sp. KX20019]QQX78576.1 DUF2271 domain-containing protein [Shewanella sp. KX20019]